MTLLSGIVVGGVGFLRFVQGVASANNTLMLEIAGRQASGAVGGQDIGVSAPVAAHVALAGPDVPDRVLPAERFGIAGADLVVVASRPKPDWTPGTVLDCGDRWLCVGEPVQRSLPVGLRTLYPLADMPGALVFRKVVRYELPLKVV